MSINFWNGYKVPPKKLSEYCNLDNYDWIEKIKYMVIENLYIDNIQGYLCNA